MSIKGNLRNSGVHRNDENVLYPECITVDVLV